MVNVSDAVALVSGTTDPYTTASFNPGASDAVLILCCMFNSAGGTTPVLTVTNPTGTAITWTSVVRQAVADGGRSGIAQIFRATVPGGSGARTVRVATNAGSAEDSGGIKLFVCTGVHATTPIGDTGAGSDTVNSFTVGVIVTTAVGSRVIGCATEWNALGTPTTTDSDDTTYGYANADVSGMAFMINADTPSSGTTVNRTFDTTGTSAAEWNWVAVEVMSGAVNQANDSDTTGPGGFFGSPASAVGAGAAASDTTAPVGPASSPATYRQVGGTPFYADRGSAISTSTSTPTVPVPPGVKVNSVILVEMFLDNAATTITGLPSGFAEAENSPVTVQNHTLHSLWKRATAEDTGTYDFTLSGSTYVEAQAMRYEDVIESGNPWDMPTDSAFDDDSETTTPAVDVTTAGPNRRVVHMASSWGGGTWTPHTGFTERIDTGQSGQVGLIFSADKEQTTAGTVSGVSATVSNPDKRGAWIGALKPTVDAGTDQPNDADTAGPIGAQATVATSAGNATTNADTTGPVGAASGPSTSQTAANASGVSVAGWAGPSPSASRTDASERGLTTGPIGPMGSPATGTVAGLGAQDQSNDADTVSAVGPVSSRAVSSGVVSFGSDTTSALGIAPSQATAGVSLDGSARTTGSLGSVVGLAQTTSIAQSIALGLTPWFGAIGLASTWNESAEPLLPDAYATIDPPPIVIVVLSDTATAIVDVDVAEVEL